MKKKTKMTIAAAVAAASGLVMAGTAEGGELQLADESNQQTVYTPSITEKDDYGRTTGLKFKEKDYSLEGRIFNDMNKDGYQDLRMDIFKDPEGNEIRSLFTDAEHFAYMILKNKEDYYYLLKENDTEYKVSKKISMPVSKYPNIKFHLPKFNPKTKTYSLLGHKFKPVRHYYEDLSAIEDGIYETLVIDYKTRDGKLMKRYSRNNSLPYAFKLILVGNLPHSVKNKLILDPHGDGFYTKLIEGDAWPYAPDEVTYKLSKHGGNFRTKFDSELPKRIDDSKEGYYMRKESSVTYKGKKYRFYHSTWDDRTKGRDGKMDTEVIEYKEDPNDHRSPTIVRYDGKIGTWAWRIMLDRKNDKNPNNLVYLDRDGDMRVDKKYKLHKKTRFYYPHKKK